MTTPATSSRVDLRGFKYPLAPLLQKLTWELTKAEQAYAKGVSDHQDEQSRLVLAQQALTQAYADAKRRQETNWHPHVMLLDLQWTQSLRQQVIQQEARVLESQQRLVNLREDWLRCQVKLEGVQRHKEESIQHFAKEQARQMAVDADRDWLARTALSTVQLRMEEISQ